MITAPFDAAVRCVARRFERAEFVLDGDDGRRFAFSVSGRQLVLVQDGQWVEANTTLVVDRDESDDRWLVDERSLANWLTVVAQRCPESRRRRASVATVSGVVSKKERDLIEVRSEDGEVCSVRSSAVWQELSVGDRIHLGDPLTYGTRFHRSLLLLWGPSKLAAHIAEEHDRVVTDRGSPVPRALLSRALAGPRRRAVERVLREKFQ